MNSIELFWMQLNWILFDFVDFFKILEFLKGVKMGILVLNFGLKGWKSLKWLKLLQNGIISEFWSCIVLNGPECSWIRLIDLFEFRILIGRGQFVKGSQKGTENWQNNCSTFLSRFSSWINMNNWSFFVPEFWYEF